MKIVIEGTPEECADAIQKLREALPCTKVSTDGRTISAEFLKLYEPCKHGTPVELECLFCAAEVSSVPPLLNHPPGCMCPSCEVVLPCPHQRPSWRMCPHCNGVNDHARVIHPAFPPAPPVGELVYPPTSTSEPVATLELPKAVTLGPQGAPIYFKRINEVELNLTFAAPCPHHALSLSINGVSTCLDCGAQQDARG